MLQVIGLVLSVTGIVSIIHFFEQSSATSNLASILVGTVTFTLGLALILMHRSRIRRARHVQDS